MADARQLSDFQDIPSLAVADFLLIERASDKKTFRMAVSELIAESPVLIRVRNESGSTLVKGKLLAVTGYDSGSDRLLVDEADKDSGALRPAIAVARADIPDNSNAEALVAGPLEDLDTSTFSLTDQLVLGNSGNVSRPPPDEDPFTGEVQLVGSVTRVHPTSGRILFEMGQGLLPTTAAQTFALAGTDGTPSKTNPYVTDSDPRLLPGTWSQLGKGSTVVANNTEVTVLADQSFGVGEVPLFMVVMETTPGSDIYVSSNHTDGNPGSNDLAYSVVRKTNGLVDFRVRHAEGNPQTIAWAAYKVVP